ncbi:glycosyltransferase family 4 protein [Nanoarchaeota archaeon]
MKKGNKLKVLRTIESFYPYMSGPANQAFRISSELERKGIKSPILTSDFGAEKRPRRERVNGVEVLRFPIKWRFMKYFYTPNIKKAYGEFDIVCAHSYRSYQTEIAYKMARKAGKPFILHNHGSLIGYRSFVKGWKKLPYLIYDIFHKNIALKADAVLVNTKQEYLETVKFGVDKNKITIVPFGIDIEKYRPMKKKIGTLNILWVGRITRDRNIEVILRAMKLLEKEDVKLKIVGNEYKRTSHDDNSELKRLKAIVKVLGIHDKVSFIPWTDKRANLEFRKADIFVYTSLWENLGQTILEAAAAGLPLVCTRVGIAQDLIEKDTGRLVKFNSPTDVSSGILSFSSLKKKSKASKILMAKVKKEFSWTEIIKKYARVYESA